MPLLQAAAAASLVGCAVLCMLTPVVGNADDAEPTRHRLDIPAVWASEGHAREAPARGSNSLPKETLRDWPWEEDGLNDWHNVSTCTCESPCDLNTATYEDMARLYKPLSLQKFHGVPGDIYSYNKIVDSRPICNPMELATTKKIWVEPKWLPKPPRPNPGYLLVLLWGCGGNQGLQGSLGGRGGCCPVTASSVYCGMKELFNTKALNANMYTKDQPDPSCDISSPYTALNPPPWCYVNDKFINFDEFEDVVLRLRNAVSTKDASRELTDTGGVRIKDQYGNVIPEWRRDEFWRGPEPTFPHTEDYMKRLGLGQSTVMDRSYELDRDKGWWTKHLKDAFNKFDANKDEHISEQEYLDSMGMGKLRGLPRRSYVRQPWERTRASTLQQEKFHNCIKHHGADKCVGKHPVTPASVDIDYDLEDSKKNPDCVMYYSENAYNSTPLRSGEVCCSNSTWEWEYSPGQWQPLVRSECVEDSEGNCVLELSDALRTALAPDSVKQGGFNRSITSRRRAYTRIRSVSEKLQGRLNRMLNMPALENNPKCANEEVTNLWDCAKVNCLAYNDRATCLGDPYCDWVELRQQDAVAPMPHPNHDSYKHACRSVLDVKMTLDRDATNQGNALKITPTQVAFDLRPFSAMIKYGPLAPIYEYLDVEKKAAAGAPLYQPSVRESWPEWWKAIQNYLAKTDVQYTPTYVKSEPSNRTAFRSECIGRKGIMLFLRNGALSPGPDQEDPTGQQWGGIYRVRQQKWYPRWVKKRNKIRCGCYPPPYDGHTTVELYPGCAATESVCLTPPDWSLFS